MVIVLGHAQCNLILDTVRDIFSLCLLVAITSINFADNYALLLENENMYYTAVALHQHSTLLYVK
jgi:hypothetical protein